MPAASAIRSAACVQATGDRPACETDASTPPIAAPRRCVGQPVADRRCMGVHREHASPARVAPSRSTTAVPPDARLRVRPMSACRCAAASPRPSADGTRARRRRLCRRRCDAGLPPRPIDGRGASADECTRAICAPTRRSQGAGCVSCRRATLVRVGRRPCSYVSARTRAARTNGADPDCARCRTRLSPTLALERRYAGCSVRDRAGDRPSVRGSSACRSLGGLETDLSDAALMLACRIAVPTSRAHCGNRYVAQRARGRRRRDRCLGPLAARVLLRALRGAAARVARPTSRVPSRRVRELDTGSSPSSSSWRACRVLGSFVR